MTQVFNENGKVIPATVVSAGPISAVQLKTKEKTDTKPLFSVLAKRKKKMFTKPSANWEILPTLRNTGRKTARLRRNWEAFWMFLLLARAILWKLAEFPKAKASKGW